MVLGKALSGNASAQTGAAQRYFPIISGLDIATFHSKSACGSREASDSGVGTRTRRGYGKLENGKTLIGPCFRRLRDSIFKLSTRQGNIDNTV